MRRRSLRQQAWTASAREEPYMPIADSSEETFLMSILRTVFVVLASLIAIIPIFWRVVYIQEYERAVHFRLGKLHGRSKGPGLVFFLPFVDDFRIIDLRVFVISLPTQEMVTKDSVTATVDGVAMIRVCDPDLTVLQVKNFKKAIRLMVETSLRSVVGSHEMDDLLTNRRKINQSLREIVERTANSWGLEVIHAEIKDLKLPLQMQRIMAIQAESERDRRATVITAVGEEQASKLYSESAKILKEAPSSLHLSYLDALQRIAGDKTQTVVMPFPVDYFKCSESSTVQS